MTINNKEYKHKGYVGCRCRYCFNKKIAKLPSINNSRLHVKRDTEKEIESSYDLKEFNLIEEGLDEEDDYQGFIDFLEDEVFETLTDKQKEEYLG